MVFKKEVLDEVALSIGEYNLIVQKLGREPTIVELGLFGSLWSEHCGYKHSRKLLKLFPVTRRTAGGKEQLGQVVIKPGEENAGAVDIGDGLCVIMKIESHNHPSAVEPYQGAATGVGGIVRDIFTMGARPIALLNSLRFGPLDIPRNRYLFNGVVGGIGGYGNCLGIPDVGGEIFFAKPYSSNPLVNAMCVGIARRDSLVSARASGVGNKIMLVGADTGRDGLHGASGLASRTFGEQPEMRSAVQVGNPFMEKLLMEACLELASTDWIVGIQDLGAAGLTSASIESAEKGGSGLDIDVLKVPRREQGMTPYEIMLSESQERMLVVVKTGCEEKVMAVFQKWDLKADVIGTVTGDGLARIREGDVIHAEAPVAILTDAPSYRLYPRKPAWIKKLQNRDISGALNPGRKSFNWWLLKLLGSPNICSKSLVFRQYDHQVLNNTVISPGGDAAVLRIKGTPRGIALSTDGNGRYCYLDPYAGGAMAVAEAARNVVCTGAIPIAITNCLNFGNPEKNDIYYQLKECIRGMARACRVLNTPVISGNVSLYNETHGEAVYPTPVVGMLGLLLDVRRHVTAGFQEKGDVVYLLGVGDDRVNDLAGSEYLEQRLGLVAGRPSIDLAMERRVQRCCLAAIVKKIIKSAHDCAEGGLAVALAESSILGGKGFIGPQWECGELAAANLFGETPSRIVVSVAKDREDALLKEAKRHRVPVKRLGTVGGASFILGENVNISLRDIEQAWKQGLEGKG
ncbi:MAG: phosphoribosylformylglycinamidine synthase subunit PurL, partial [Dehalococcoidia bacterium]|nr:phosphoribosylformylglycinamidine synthase subunit PurL [Dehalococcoidia bacterium]